MRCRRDVCTHTQQAQACEIAFMHQRIKHVMHSCMQSTPPCTWLCMCACARSCSAYKAMHAASGALRWVGDGYTLISLNAFQNLLGQADMFSYQPIAASDSHNYLNAICATATSHRTKTCPVPFSERSCRWPHIRLACNQV